jgi:hypothetical protein
MVIGGYILGALAVGFICGLLPLYVARKKGREQAGQVSRLICLGAGLFGGGILAIPAAIICALVIGLGSTTTAQELSTTAASHLLVQQGVAQAPLPLSSKTCPKCAEKIQLEALVCRFCGTQFSESEVQTMKQQIEEQAREAKRLAEAQAQEAKRIADENAARAKILQKKKSRQNWGWILAVIGGLALAFGGLCGLLDVLMYLMPAPNSSVTLEGTISVLIVCATPFLLGGAAMLVGGIYVLRKVKRIREETDSNSVQPSTGA